MYIPADRALAARVAAAAAAAAQASEADVSLAALIDASAPGAVPPAEQLPEPVSQTPLVDQAPLVQGRLLDDGAELPVLLAAEPQVVVATETIAVETTETMAVETTETMAVEPKAPVPSRPVSSRPAASRPESVPLPSRRQAPAPVAERPLERPAEHQAERPAEAPADRPYDLEVAIACARIAARRRAVIMGLLFAVSVASWAIASWYSLSAWVAAPATTLLILHTLASRAAGLRSRETLTVFAAQLHSAELAQARPQRQVTPTARPAEVPAELAEETVPDRVARRAAAVGAETWEPVPVPPPTYTLKPAVHRPEPAPLDLPATAATGSAAAPAAVSRGALPRRAADIERILAIDTQLDEGFEERKAVNG